MLLCIIYRYECTRLLVIFLSSYSNDIVFSKSIVHFAVAYIPEHLRSPSVCGRVRVVKSFVFYVVYCVLLCVGLSFFLFSYDVVSLFLIYEFDCPSGIFLLLLLHLPGNRHPI